VGRDITVISSMPAGCAVPGPEDGTTWVSTTKLNCVTRLVVQGVSCQLYTPCRVWGVGKVYQYTLNCSVYHQLNIPIPSLGVGVCSPNAYILVLGASRSSSKPHVAVPTSHWHVCTLQHVAMQGPTPQAHVVWSGSSRAGAGEGQLRHMATARCTCSSLLVAPCMGTRIMWYQAIPTGATRPCTALYCELLFSVPPGRPPGRTALPGWCKGV
jgi:hypothetical protein